MTAPAPRAKPAQSAERKPRTTVQRGTAGQRAYDGLRDLIFSYEIKPDERLNEGELAKRFGVSRTPVREALNRLVTENLLGFRPSIGFYRPKINVDEILDLYELRRILELEGLRLAIRRADDAEIQALIDEWAAVDVCSTEVTQSERIAADERFHERLIGLSHNGQLVAALHRLNAQIHFVRWAPTEKDQDHRRSYQRHVELLEVLREREEEKAIAALRGIIDRRREDLLEILKEGAAKLYLVT